MFTFGQNMQQRAVVLMAASPQAFDARSSGAMGSFSAVGQPKDQGQCNSCVAFAVLAAAQSAIACALQQDASSSLSEHDFFFCKTVSRGEERTCASSWTMRQGIEALVNTQFAGRYPVTERCKPWTPSKPNCVSYECQDVYHGLKEGTFSYVRLESVWEMQEHIRQWGSFVTRLEIYSDIRPFFISRPSGTYPGHGPKATFVTSHAIQVVGYDLETNPPSWLCKNSWGTGFAAGGFFRIAFGVDGVGSPDDTYGIKFNTKYQRPKPFNRLSPAGQGGCYNYRALPTDFVSRVASVFGTSPAQILLDNRDRIREPDMYLADMTILLCGISVPQLSAQQVAGVVGTQGSQSSAQSRLEPQPSVKPPAIHPAKRHRYWLINTLDTTHNHRYSEIYRTAPGSHVCADVNDTFFWTCLDCLDNTVATKREQVSWAGSDVIMFPSSGVGNDRVMLRLQQNAATRAPGSTVGHIYLWVPCSGQSREGCCDGFCRPAGTCYRPKDGQYTCDEGRWLQTWLYFCDT